VILGDGYCLEKGAIIHELMHAVGFWHEHQRPDRDDWVNILWDNIIDGGSCRKSASAVMTKYWGLCFNLLIIVLKTERPRLVLLYR